MAKIITVDGVYDSNRGKVRVKYTCDIFCVHLEKYYDPTGASYNAWVKKLDDSVALFSISKKEYNRLHKLMNQDEELDAETEEHIEPIENNMEGLEV